MKSLDKICREVGEWTTHNFGFQETRYMVGDLNGSVALPDGDVITVRLGSTAPLMGIAEELGELFESGSHDGFADAIADMVIYAMDYTCREGMFWPQDIRLADKEEEFDAITGVVVMVGRLFHANLKRHQGIRGFERDGVYEEAREAALVRLVYYLMLVCEDVVGSTLESVVNETWEKVVKKRDWRK